MEIIEKQIEKVKEVPAECYDSSYWGKGKSYSTPFASKGVAGTALGIGIGALALSLLNRNGNWNLFGNSSPQNVNINADMTTSPMGMSAPTTFQTWVKSCDDALHSQKALYDYALLAQSERFNDRQTLNAEIFSLYKGQTDADFALYKFNRDGIDALANRQTTDTFNLYKQSRDSHDELANRISALETKQAINDAVDPWRAKVLDMQIQGVAQGAQSAVALEAERRCCADNKIVTYVNGTFQPLYVADITPASTTTARTLYNPLCGCCLPYGINL